MRKYYIRLRRSGDEVVVLLDVNDGRFFSLYRFENDAEDVITINSIDDAPILDTDVIAMYCNNDSAVVYINKRKILFTFHDEYVIVTLINREKDITIEERKIFMH